jgi:hypothetical protein
LSTHAISDFQTANSWATKEPFDVPPARGFLIHIAESKHAVDPFVAETGRESLGGSGALDELTTISE